MEPVAQGLYPTLTVVILVLLRVQLARELLNGILALVEESLLVPLYVKRLNSQVNLENAQNQYEDKIDQRTSGYYHQIAMLGSDFVLAMLEREYHSLLLCRNCAR